MTRFTRLSLGSALAAALLGLLAPLSVGCSNEKAHWVSTTVEPPAPCLDICVSVSQLGGEVMEITNHCPREALALTGPYFAQAGQPTFKLDGAITAYSDNVGPGQAVTFVATLAAVQQTELSMTGTLGGVFETVTVSLAAGAGTSDGPFCQVSEGAGDAQVGQVDGH